MHEKYCRPELRFVSTAGQAPDKIIQLTSIDTTCIISSPNPMVDNLLESSQLDDCNKRSNIEFGEKIGIIEIKLQ